MTLKQYIEDLKKEIKENKDLIKRLKKKSSKYTEIEKCELTLHSTIRIDELKRVVDGLFWVKEIK